ncbi:MAG: YidB family protein [Pseudorhodoplanes sp.]
MGILDVILGRDAQGRSSKVNMALIAILLWRMYKSATAPAGGGVAKPMPNPLPGKTKIPIPAPAPAPSSGSASRLPGGEGSLGDILGGGMESLPRGGASRGGGGLGDILGDILGGGAGRSGGGRGMPQGGGGGLPGGLGDILGGILRGNPNMRAAGDAGGGFDDILKQLGPVLGGAAAGGLLSGGLNDLLRDFQENGHADAAQSWISRGDNIPVSPREIEDTFGAQTISDLAAQLGMPKAELLSGLSEALPQVVDSMTPDGRMPTDEEISRWT